MHPSLQIPGYSIQAEIGKGGMATVYVAIQESLSRTVALKIMSPQALPGFSAEERFLKEAKIVARLSHPNIVTVYNIGRVDSIYYMAMEYIGGGNLRDRIFHGLPATEVCRITRQVATALTFAHNRGFVHRDVKPANILFREDGTVVLSDFGIAKAISPESTSLTAIGHSLGTPEYMSPEQTKGESLDSRSDLYSLGIVVYEMLTGEKPFRSTDPMGVAIKHVVESPPPLPQHLKAFQPLLDSLLAKDPEERLSSAEQLIHGLEELGEGAAHPEATTTHVAESASSVEDPSSLPRTALQGRKSTGQRMVLVSVLAVVLLATGGALYYWQTTLRVDPQTQKVIDLLLHQAELHVRNANLLEPADVNAYQYYQNVLEFDPTNDKALAGLEMIASELEDQIRTLQWQEKYDDALQLVNRGLEFYPKKAAFISLEENLAAQRDEQKRLLDIAELFEKAAEQKAAGNIVSPESDSAYRSYRSILELDPGNAEALQELGAIADNQEKKAREKQQQGRIVEALTLIERGLEIDPRHRGLAELQEELNQELANKQTEQRITRLLGQAKEQLAADRLTRPQGDNALDTYRTVQGIDAQNAEAQAGLRELAERIENKAIDARERGELDQALAMIEQGLTVVPDDAGLVELRSAINRQREAAENRRRVLRTLLLEAERQIEASQWTEPADANALATYRDILKIEPGNTGAQSGLSRIASHFERLAREHRQSGAIQAGLDAIEQGLEADSDRAALLSLRTDLKQLEAQQHEERKRQQIRALLDRADTQRANTRLTEPEGDNAAETYRQVLALSPRDPHALSGMQAIADELYRIAGQKLAQGETQASTAVIEQGLSVDPNHSGLLALNSDASRRFEESQSRTALDELLALGDRQIQELKLTRPRGSSAYDSYSRALQLSPNNERALAGLERIADRYLAMGRARLEEGELEASLVFIDRGLDVMPEHSRLLSLKNDAERQGESAQVDTAPETIAVEPADQLTGLLDEAQQKVASGQFTQPEGDNALEIYREILRLEPNNPLALEGLESVAGHFEALAHEKHQEGELEQSLVLVEEGLTIAPEHSGLLDLQDKLDDQLKPEPEEKPKDAKRRRRPVFGTF